MNPVGLAALGRRYLFYTLISALVGVGISFLIMLGDGRGIDIRGLLVGAVIGVTICAVNFGLTHAVSRWLEKSPGLTKAMSRVLFSFTFVAGGIVGFLLGEALAAKIFPTVVVPGALRAWLPFIVIFSLVIGLLIYAYEGMRQRLRSSVERIKEQEFAERELELARSIQKRLLPPHELTEEGYSVAARNEAASYVAGDYFDIFRLSNGDLGFVVADVAGKGIGASLIMASTKAMLPFIASESTVAEALSALNERLVRDLGPREFVALCYVRFSVADRRVEIANAGLPDPYRVTRDGRVETLEVDGQRLPLGARAEVVYRSREWVLDPGDRLLMFSDGLAEAPGPDGMPLGYEKLADLLPRTDETPAEWLTVLFEKLRSETRSELADDWTAILLQVM